MRILVIDDYMDLSKYGDVDRQSLAMLFVPLAVFQGSLGDCACGFLHLWFVLHACLRVVSDLRTDDAKLGETRFSCLLAMIKCCFCHVQDLRLY